METGSKLKTNFQDSFSVVPDREGATAPNRVAQITRTGIVKASYDSDLLSVTGINGIAFPYCIDDRTWCEMVQQADESENSSVYLIEPTRFCTVPSALFREEDIHRYFEPVGASLGDQSILINEIPDLGVHFISTIPKIINDGLENGQILPDILPVLKALQPSAQGTTHIILREEHIDILVYQNELQLVNRFTAEHENDILYFCVAAVEQCGLDVEKIQLTLSGTEERIGKNIKLLSKYFPSVNEPSLPSKLQVPYGFKDIKAAWCWPLLNAHLCV